MQLPLLKTGQIVYQPPIDVHPDDIPDLTPTKYTHIVFLRPKASPLAGDPVPHVAPLCQPKFIVDRKGVEGLRLTPVGDLPWNPATSWPDALRSARQAATTESARATTKKAWHDSAVYAFTLAINKAEAAEGSFS